MELSSADIGLVYKRSSARSFGFFTRDQVDSFRTLDSEEGGLLMAVVLSDLAEAREIEGYVCDIVI